MRRSIEAGTRRLVSAVNYTELLIGPLRAAGPAGADVIDAMLVRLGIETIQVDMDLARRAAAVRAETNLRLPDAYVVATAVHAAKRGDEDVRLETFDLGVARAFAGLRATPS